MAEQFTGIPGVLVPIEDTIKGFNMILNGELDQYPEAAFNLKGNIEEVIEAGEKMLAEGLIETIMTVDILTPDTTLFSGEASFVGLPGVRWKLGHLEQPRPLVTTLKAGQVVVRAEGGEQTFDVNGGSVEVLNNVVTVLAE